MSRSIFGWSYPPGCSGTPFDEDEPEQLRCKQCKSFISLSAAKTEPWESSYLCEGDVDADGWASCGHIGVGKPNHAPHKVVMDAGHSQVVTCKRCKKENKFG